MLGLAERVVVATAALSTKRSALAVERDKANEAIQYLEIAQTITVDKEKELEQDIRAKLNVQEMAAKVQTEMETTQVDLVATHAKGKNLAETAKTTKE